MRDSNIVMSVIRTRKQYQTYLEVVSDLIERDPSAASEEGKILETLAILIEAYEAKQGWESPSLKDPVHVIKTRMEDLDLRQADLVKVIGNKSTVSRILNGSRKLTYGMVLPLSKLLRVPPEFLLEKPA